MDFFQKILTAVTSFDFTPFKLYIDLNDLRNIAAIAGVSLALKTASSKWGNKAVFFATIGASHNSPIRITSISIANLKDKPLVIYKINVIFKKSGYYELQKFDPPLVIKGLEATSITTTPYSDLEIEPNPFLNLNPKYDVILITESAAIKCKPAKSPEVLSHKHMKKHQLITVKRKKLNDKIYSNHADWGLIYIFEGTQRTSFLAKSGAIYDDWPFTINTLTSEEMKNPDTIKEAFDEIGKKYNTKISIVKLVHFDNNSKN